MTCPHAVRPAHPGNPRRPDAALPGRPARQLGQCHGPAFDVMDFGGLDVNARRQLAGRSLTVLMPTRMATLMATLVAAWPTGASAHCLVVGPPGAEVREAAQRLRPVAAVRDCALLRLVQGQATALWTGRDGQPASGAVRHDAPPEGYPGGPATTPTQPLVDAVRALAGDGRSARMGYKRQVDGLSVQAVHVPAAGLLLPAPAHSAWQLQGLAPGREQPLASGQAPAEGGLLLMPGLFDGFDALRVQWASGTPERQVLMLQRLGPEREARLAQQLRAAQALPGLDDSARAWAMALVYEQHGLALNRDLTLPRGQGPQRSP